MIEALKDDAIVKRCGGNFRLTALVQRRMKEIVDGSRPLVDTKDKNLVQIVVQEILEEKIAIDFSKSEGLLKLNEDGTINEKAN